MRYLIIVSLVLSFAFSHSRVNSQEPLTCPRIVEQAIEVAGRSCDTLNPNEACYGNFMLFAQLAENSTTTFSEVGARTAVAMIEQLRLSPMNLDFNRWGIALMNVQANLPDTVPGQLVTFVMFGDVEVVNTGEAESTPLPSLTVTRDSGSSINLRGGPNTSFDVIGSMASGTSLVTDGRNSSGDWLRVRTDSGTAWVSAGLVTVDGDVSSLSVVGTQDTTVYGPMQSFTLRSGIGDRACQQAPDSGILIQTPQGVLQVHFSINDVDIRLGSTAYLTGDELSMRFAVLEGTGTVSIAGQQFTVPAGTRARIERGENQSVSVTVEPYADAAYLSLPLQLLPRPITIAAPNYEILRPRLFPTSPGSSTRGTGTPVCIEGFGRVDTDGTVLEWTCLQWDYND